MMGAAALLMGASFTSCSSDNDLYDPQANATKFLQAYESAFIEVFGTPAANQTWGFGNAAASRMTRANEGETVPQTEAYHNMNHNEWADPDKEFGGYVVPDPLTADQKAVVAAYFQSVPNLTYEDPHLRHFFVQQVYKGGKVDAGQVRNTTEGITAANGTKYDSGNMNLLSVGQNNIHINNFNAGSCSTSNVLDNGQHVGGSSHTDQITLMVNIDDTSCFGYHETGSSTQHNNKAALVSWQTIRDWANANGLNGNCLADDWNRSFLGFDLAIKEGAQAYATDDNGNVLYATYDQAPESPKYAWDGEKVIEIADPNKSWPVEYYDDYKTIKKGSESIGWLTTNQNFYVAADKVTLSQTISFNRAQLTSISGIQDCVVLKEVMDGNQWYQAVLNLPKIQQLVNDGYLPVKDNSLTKWVKVGKSDGYYSDWIVTLTKAERQIPEDKPDYRIIAEDLTVADSGNDFDFNDVVFDVYYDKNDDTKATVRLQAAGGTLPLEIRDAAGVAHEVHEVYGVKTTDMVNTGAGPNKNDKFYEFEVTINKNDRAGDDGLKIFVNKGGNNPEQLNFIELPAEVGHVAAKVKVDDTYIWCRERVDIETVYQNFPDYVQHPENYAPTRGKSKWWEE